MALPLTIPIETGWFLLQGTAFTNTFWLKNCNRDGKAIAFPYSSMVNNLADKLKLAVLYQRKKPHRTVWLLVLAESVRFELTVGRPITSFQD